jgi:hypothetical protein
MKARHDEPAGAAPCCPDLSPDTTCDRLDFTRVLQMPLQINDLQSRIFVRLFLHFRIERCPGPLSLGDPAYSTTLLPGEKVRLFVSDRRNSFTYDSTTKVSYRHQHMSEDQYYMRAFRASYAKSEAEQTGKYSSEYNEKKTNMSGEIDGGIIGDIFGGPSFGVSNSAFSSSAVSSYANRQRSSFHAADSQAVAATRTTSSVSVGEVSTRTHVEGTSEEHFESSSREFSNPNRCHAVTYIFYRINKRQTVTFSLVDIDREIVSPAGADFSNIDPDQLEKILQQVDKKLIALGIFDKEGAANPEYMKKFFAQQVSSIPTPGIIVKGCLDDCDMCEDTLDEKYKLQNEMLKKQIELLEKSQEYRCCPCEEETQE